MWGSRHRGTGIALVEFVILASLLSLAAGIVIPMVNDRVAAAARAQALGDLRHIAADLLNYRRDTGIWPVGGRFAFTDGESAVNEDICFGAGPAGTHISTFLAANAYRLAKWRGPYMSRSRPDPWGNRYVIVLEGLRGPLRPYGWIVSAGPDGIFQTGSHDRCLQGDDLGLLLR